jgi:hypothetical protein
MSEDENNEMLPEKTMAERAQEIGRDGAYLEVDASQLLAAHKNGELGKAKIVVIKMARIELSDSEDIARLQKLICKVVAAQANPPSFYTDMSDEQASVALMRGVVTSGLVV